MSLISVAALIAVLFNLELFTECNNDSIVTVAGYNVSLEWTLSNTSLNSTTSFKIYNSSHSVIAETAVNKCVVVDTSSTHCNIHDCDKDLIVTLTILKLTERQNGNYTLRLQAGWEGVSNSTKMLVIIGKPKITEAGKPILGKPFKMTCNIPQEIECMIYRWKINGIQTNNLWSRNSHFVTSVLLADNLSQVTCQVCLNETSSNVSRVICKPDGCSTESDAYTIQVIRNPSTTAQIITSTEVIGMGLVGVAVLLVVLGILLVIQCNKNMSNKTVVNHRMPTTGEMLQGISRIQNRPLPALNTQETASSGPYRPKYPHHKRKSRSLDNLFGTEQNSFNPLRSDFSLQVLYSPANIMGREIKNGTQGNNSIKGKRVFSCEENQPGDMSGLKLEFLNTKVCTDTKTNRDEHSDVAKPKSLNNIRDERFEDTQENLYSTIDEDALSDYDEAKKE